MDEIPKGPKERLYDKIPLNIRQLDIVIICLVVAFVVFLIMGILAGRGIIPPLF